ncbi:hypothetical protein K439DRAFT_1622353 [Ramaria rubella]|nr:hypothetical protein K439DRAFT_1622353 [Ramaria rubella]
MQSRSRMETLALDEVESTVLGDHASGVRYPLRYTGRTRFVYGSASQTQCLYHNENLSILLPLSWMNNGRHWSYHTFTSDKTLVKLTVFCISVSLSIFHFSRDIRTTPSAVYLLVESKITPTCTHNLHRASPSKIWMQLEKTNNKINLPACSADGVNVEVYRRRTSLMSHPSDADAMLPDHPLPEDDPTYCASCCSFYSNKSLLRICVFCSHLQKVQKSDSVLYVDMQKWPRCEDCGVGGQNLPPGNPHLCGTCKSVWRNKDPQVSQTVSTAMALRQTAVDTRINGRTSRSRASLADVTPRKTSAPNNAFIRDALPFNNDGERSYLVIVEPRLKNTTEFLFGVVMKSWPESTPMASITQYALDRYNEVWTKVMDFLLQP